MHSIEKELQKLSAKEQAWVKEVLTKLVSGETRGLDIQKLKGSADIFRVRKGDIRVIYRLVGKKVYVLRVVRRSERTYK